MGRSGLQRRSLGGSYAPALNLCDGTGAVWSAELRAGRLRLLPVMLRVILGGFRGVVQGMVKVALSGVGVVGCGLVVTRFVMLGRFAMMPCSVLVMFGCLDVMLCCLLGHVSSSNLGLGGHRVDCARLD